jgi:protoheme IX farnesyltransferase
MRQEGIESTSGVPDRQIGPLRGRLRAAARFGLTVSHFPDVVPDEPVAGAVTPGPTAPRIVAVPPAPPSRWRRAAGVLRAYLLLTKPRVIELLLVTTVPAMVLAAGELPSIPLILAVLLGGALAAGGANTINCWIERDRDQVMRRTHSRPLPAGVIAPRDALVFGLVLEAAAFAWLWATVNLLSAALAVSAMLFYIFVYTIWLKPRSPQNIVIGGAAGAVPVLVGWAAVTGELAAPAWVLFAIVFCWTPPHFWALALRYEDDYRAAGIPMLPVVRGTRAAARQILVYAVVVVATTFLLLPFGDVGVLYIAAAAVLGALFIARAAQLERDVTPARAIQFFTFSNTYLALLFAAIAVDTLIRSL